MPDFAKLRAERSAAKSANPRDIFARLVKPEGVRDLLPGQRDVLDAWWSRRNSRDLVVKQNTGGGKTLVGLLIAESTMAELGGRVLYLCPDNYLVEQTLSEAKKYNLAAERYESGKKLPHKFLSGEALLVGTYPALFNGHSRFGVRGSTTYQSVSAVILDDAHVKISSLRNSFSIVVDGRRESERAPYERLISILRPAFAGTGRESTLVDILEGKENSVLEVPYWRWTTVLEDIVPVLRDLDHIAWPLLRDELRHCHCLIGRHSVAVVPIFPAVEAIPSFSGAPRRVFMSATIADDSALAATFGIKDEAFHEPITTTSLASVGERMILVPGFQPNITDEQVRGSLSELFDEVERGSKGVVILTPSFDRQAEWNDMVRRRPSTPSEVELEVQKLRSGDDRRPLALANRYDGIDLAGDACRLLVLDGLPQGSSLYDQYRSSSLVESGEGIISMVQRVEQGLGRASRGGGDWCVVVVLGSDIAEWLSRREHWQTMTASSRAQVTIGETISKDCKDVAKLLETARKALSRDPAWIAYHQEALADYVEQAEEKGRDDSPIMVERAAHDKAILGDYFTASRMLKEAADHDSQLSRECKAWLLQMSARYAWLDGNQNESQVLQKNAFVLNRSLHRPSEDDPYAALPGPISDQASSILRKLDAYTRPAAYVAHVSKQLAALQGAAASTNAYEAALADLGEALGFSAERPDKGRRPRKGPDVLWLCPELFAFVIEAKNGKAYMNPLNRDEHGQLLQSEVWFKEHYKHWSSHRVAVLPSPYYTESVDLGETKAWDAAMISSIAQELVSALREISALKVEPRRHVQTVTILNAHGLTVQDLIGRYTPLAPVADKAGERVPLDL